MIQTYKQLPLGSNSYQKISYRSNAGCFPLIIIITMQYLRGQQNNRLNFSHLDKKLHFQVDFDPALDSGSEVTADECDIKRELSFSSTIDSRFKPHKQSFSEDSQYSKEGQQEELCQDFHNNGYCLKGTKCCFSHEGRSISEIKCGRKGMFRTQLLQRFPEMIGVTYFQRIGSFLQ